MTPTSERKHLWILGLLAGLPLLVLLGRVAGAPTAAFLNEHLSLAGIPPDIHEALNYVLFVPLGALLVVLARLTLGIRLLGPFRAILLAIAFQVAGIGLGLLFLAVVVAVVAAVRPGLKEIRLPYFARVAFILGVIAGTVLFSVLCASMLGIESIHRVAYFPIIALCLFADGLLQKIPAEGARSALWRAATTTVLAMLIALSARIPGLQALLGACPELLVVQLALIVFVARHLDLRLFESLNPDPRKLEQTGRFATSSGIRPFRVVGGGADADAPAARVAIVRNRSRDGVIDQLGRRCPEVYGKRSVQMVIDAFEAAGNETRLFEGDMTLLDELKDYVDSGGDRRSPVIVFNLAYGIQGNARYTHVPAMLEMAGVPYTGSDPFSHALALDKVVTKVLISDLGVPTPAFKVMHGSDDDPGDMRYPMIVKPRGESTSYGLHVVNNPYELAKAVEDVNQRYDQGALVEEFIDGREFTVSMLGNETLEVLPIVELVYPDRRVKAFTLEDKYHKTSNEPQKLAPAPLEPAVKAKMEELAVKVYRACHCRDYGKVDFRLDEDGNPYVLEINSMASLGPGGSFVYAAKHAGYTFESLMWRILDIAAERYWPRTKAARTHPVTARAGMVV